MPAGITVLVSGFTVKCSPTHSLARLQTLIEAEIVYVLGDKDGVLWVSRLSH